VKRSGRLASSRGIVSRETLGRLRIDTMNSGMPQLSPSQFSDRLQAAIPFPLGISVVDALYAHYAELIRWNAILNLIGPGTIHEIVERHYAESLLALDLLPTTAGSLLDLGSGAGFPGLVLAACRRDLSPTLVESRERKCAFIESAARHASLPCRCLNVRVRLPLPVELPEGIQVITSRALRIGRSLLAELAKRLGASGAIVLWTTETRLDLPESLTVEGVVEIGGGTARQIQLLRPKARQSAREL